jgi:pyruvate/2-oxoglutarate dehydrogenase complex dihydrolipoamide acyltransferase (E2) component
LPKPTASAIKKHPAAVVILTYVDDDPNPAVHDFEWFDTTEGLTEYFTATSEWAAEDVALMNGVLRHAVVEVTDTGASPLTLGRIATFGGEQDWQNDVIASIATAPDSILVAANRRSPGAAVKKTTKKAAQVAKGRKPSPAANAAKGKAAPAADKAKEAPVVRKVAKPKAPAAKKAAKQPPKGDAAKKPVDREALKARLAAKAAKQRKGDTAEPEGSLVAFAQV